jgi:hypothetical protein
MNCFRYFDGASSAGYRLNTKPLPTQGSATQNITDIHRCLERDSNSQYQCSSCPRLYALYAGWSLQLAILFDITQNINAYFLCFHSSCCIFVAPGHHVPAAHNSNDLPKFSYLLLNVFNNHSRFISCMDVYNSSVSLQAMKSTSILIHLVPYVLCLFSRVMKGFPS